MAEIEGAVLDEMKKKPDKAIRHPQILKQVKQAAGALADDYVLPERPINVSLFQAVMADDLKAYMEG
ncbi:MAG: hypothetical protein GTN76_02495, partial [Candidatus Aenigmarchaeota archaeon]|nr:hypothetical protein [Candidatus Aenigmarchaeota archaeon]